MSLLRLILVVSVLALLLACSGQQADGERTEAAADDSGQEQVFEEDFEEGTASEWQAAGDDDAGDENRDATPTPSPE